MLPKQAVKLNKEAAAIAKRIVNFFIGFEIKVFSGVIIGLSLKFCKFFEEML